MDQQRLQIWLPYIIIAIVFICTCCLMASAIAMPVTYSLFNYFQ